MAGFAVEDAFLKTAAQGLPFAMVMMAFGAGGALAFGVLARLNGQSLAPRSALSPAIAIRATFEVIGRLFYTLAIALTPLSSTSSILQATPIVVVAGAALVFGETVGWRRWAAILLGLVGVLVILQPGAEAFTPLSLLAVAGMLGFAGRDLTTRAAPPGIGTFTLGVFGFLPVLLVGIGWGLVTGDMFERPTSGEAAALTGAIVFGVVGYASLTIAMRTGDVSAVTPFRYTRLLFGIAFGVLLFGEALEPNMIVGSGIIVLAGLYILTRSRRGA